MKKIAVFTSGGDAPGMNAAIRSAVRTALYHGVEICGIMGGYQGLIDGNIIEMNSQSVANIIQRGGTILKTSRSEEFRTTEGRVKAAVNVKKYGIEGLVAIGGDGTFTGAEIFCNETGITVMGVPGTIDNDLFGTDYTIGFDTAVNTAIDAIDKIRDTADSHNRTFFVEVMGRHAGFIAMDVGICGGAEAILLPDIPTDMDELVRFFTTDKKKQKSFSIVVVAEGDDAGGAFTIVEKLKVLIPEFDARVSVLGHIQRGGKPSAYDRLMGSRLGSAAVVELIEGVTNKMVGIVSNELILTSFHEAINQKKKVDVSLLKLAKMLA
ncbi:MAG: 6-phosphofructokinase [Flavobacteriaceae bacterium]|nr:6-phosphofructokinase [Flavobacteriaceae bacterium]